MSSPRKEHARELFAGIAGNYDRWAQLLSFGQDRRWHELLNDRLDVGPDALVADVATGTAAVAIDLARRRGCRVVGIDQSEQMLARGRRRVDDAGLAGQIELRAGEAEALPLADASVDALVHTYLLRYVDDVEATLRELARVLQPGGTLVLSDLHPIASQRGWRRSFTVAGGERIVIHAPPPQLERVQAALDAAGFALERRVEPAIDERLRPAFEDAGRRDFEALSGTPLLQLYRARKRGSHAR